mgnify:CR=1 FL=1
MKYHILRTRSIPKNHNPIFETSICLLKCRCEGFLFQLRDDRNDIKFPGTWGLFGGSIENGESSIDSVVIDINEELNVQLPKENFLFLCLLVLC